MLLSKKVKSYKTIKKVKNKAYNYQKSEGKIIELEE